MNSSVNDSSSSRQKTLCSSNEIKIHGVAWSRTQINSHQHKTVSWRREPLRPFHFQMKRCHYKRKKNATIVPATKAISFRARPHWTAQVQKKIQDQQGSACNHHKRGRDSARMNSLRRALSSLILFFSEESRGLIFRFSSSIHLNTCRCSSSDSGGRTLLSAGAGAGAGAGSAAFAVALVGDDNAATAADAAAASAFFLSWSLL